MIHDVVFADEAVRDIERIYAATVEKFGQLYTYCKGFDLFPRRGMMRDDLISGVRVVGYRKLATIAFLVEDGTVTIARVFAAGQEVRLAPPA